ncbi:nucleotide sugar dehydrogenase [Virgibacillus sp. M23]|uniref:nucleotide sugar dehydrogenase n=1 Tax=Virgibacillus sp. M23 TaxID=3079030 RepID=UPI002A90C9AC|nr:nucleotide sugar dehydrogenase [Virgibacillus sp. M23]MDY7043660.1 nucleotide sugar dehydrogenase [Virgibacillus sp. M23]
MELLVKPSKSEESLFESLYKKIDTNTAVVGVIGMGYVGLPNIISKAKRGNSVIGFDLDESKVNMVNRGGSYISDVKSEELSNLVLDRKKIFATSDFSLLSNVDVILICVPTPIDEYKQPNLSYIKKASIDILRYAEKGALVILESTTYPSTTEDYIVKNAVARGLNVGEDFFVAYSPERIDPSNKTYNVDNTPRIVGGHTSRCTQLAEKFIGGSVLPVSSTKVAEMSKVYENTFRYVNIALANELTLICNKMGLDPWEVIEASKTKPYGFMPFYPTAGVGGHCIPVDPYYLSWYSKKFNCNAQMIELAGEINNKMSDYAVDRINGILNSEKLTLFGSKIAILGASYKKDISDVRESPIFRLYESLIRMGANITIYDPHVDSIRIKDTIVNIEDIDYNELGNYDVVVLLTAHSDFNYYKIADKSRNIFDTRDGFKEVGRFKGNYYKM